MMARQHSERNRISLPRTLMVARCLPARVWITPQSMDRLSKLTAGRRQHVCSHCSSAAVGSGTYDPTTPTLQQQAGRLVPAGCRQLQVRSNHANIRQQLRRSVPGPLSAANRLMSRGARPRDSAVAVTCCTEGCPRSLSSAGRNSSTYTEHIAQVPHAIG